MTDATNTSGVATEWGWRVRSPAANGHPAGPWHWQMEEPTGSTAEFCDFERVYVGLQSPSAADAKPVARLRAAIAYCDARPDDKSGMVSVAIEDLRALVQPQPNQQAGVEGVVMSSEDAPVWAEGIVTDGENVAIAQKAEADYGGTYWSVETGDGAIMWEPTHFIPLAALKLAEG